MSETYIYNLTDTWNNGSSVFDAIKMNVTNTASASGSKLLNLQIGGVEKFTVDVDGIVTAATPTTGDNSTKVATTAFVDTAVSAISFDVSNLTATWNNGATDFDGIKLDITNTASGAGSDLLDLRVDSSSKMSVKPNGTIVVGDNSISTLAITSPTGLAAGSGISFNNTEPTIRRSNANHSIFNSTGLTVLLSTGEVQVQPAGYFSIGENTRIYQDGDNQLAQRNSTNAQSLSVYNTYTDASNYERFTITASSTNVKLNTQSVGTGSVLPLLLGIGNGSQWAINTSGNFIAYGSDNLRDIGSATNRIRNVYVGSDVIVDGSFRLNNPINTQTGTTYTPVLTDAERYIQLNNAGAITLTVPSDTTTALPIGTTITFEQTGAGTVTFTADSGVTINSRGAVVATAGQFSVASIIKTAANTFTLTGDLA